MNNLLPTPSPGKKAEQSCNSECCPCEPEKCGISLGLSTPINAVNIDVGVVVLVDTAIDDNVLGEMSAIQWILF